MEKSIKIAVFHNLPSGGAKRALFDHVKYLTNSHHKVDVFIPSTANEDYLPLKDVSTDIKEFPVEKTFSSLIRTLISYRLPVNELHNLKKAQKLIAEQINQGDYDVVFVEQDQYTMTPFIMEYLKKPVVYYCQQPLRHDEVILKIVSKDNPKNKQSLRKIVYNYIDKRFVSIDKKIVEYAKYTLSNSYFSRESILKNYGINSFVCYLGIDTETFKSIDVPKEDFVLSVGSYISSKGHDFIIKSLALIDAKIRPKFIIVSNGGDDYWKNYIQELAQNLDVELEILTLIDDEKLVKLYNQAKLVLYSPHLEPFGLVPLEAMACGTPVVSVKEGGVRETVLHNETGLLVDGDESLFAKATEELILKDSKRLEMGKKSIENVLEHWTVEKAGKRLEWHLGRAINLEK